MIFEIKVKDNLYVQFEKLYYGEITDKSSKCIMFNIVENYLNINGLYELEDSEIKLIVKALNLDGFIDITKKQEINKQREETLNNIIKDSSIMDRREKMIFKDRLDKIKEYIRL